MRCRQAWDCAADAPLPKSVVVLHGKAFGSLIPEPEMEFDRQWHIRIVIVAVGAPAGHSNHGREMVDCDLSYLSERLVPKRLDRLKGRLDRVRRAIEVQIVLRAMPRIGGVMRPLRETLENQEIDASLRERGRCLLVC